jgi:hypothetical protein
MKIPRLLIALLVAAAPVAQAEIVLFGTGLAPEAPGATGSGTVQLTWDSVQHTLAIGSDWTDLSGTTTVAHIHCCTAAPGTGNAGVAVTPATLPGFPVGTTSGSYDVVLDMTSDATYTDAFRTGPGGGTSASAEAALIQSFFDGTSYFNIHSALFPTGEIRGFFAPLAIPEPGTYALILLGMGAMTAAKRSRRS